MKYKQIKMKTNKIIILFLLVAFPLTAQVRGIVTDENDDKICIHSNTVDAFAFYL